MPGWVCPMLSAVARVCFAPVTCPAVRLAPSLPLTGAFHSDRAVLGCHPRSRTVVPLTPSENRFARPPAGRPICPDPSRRAHRLARPAHLDRPRAVPGVLRGPDVRGHRRLPPILRPPGVQDEPALPVCARVAGVHGDAEGAAVVGQPPPPAPPTLRPGGRPALPH